MLQIALAVLVVALGVYKVLQIGRRAEYLPPGPPTVPVLGNLTTIPPRYSHLYFFELGKKYGDVVSLKLFNGTMVVLNSAEAVADLLDKRSASFNDRAPAYINDDLIARNNHILLANGKTSTLYRKLWNKSLAQSVVSQHIGLQNAEGSAVLYNILNRPKDWYDEMRRYSCSLTLSIAYGKRAATYDEVDKAGFSVKEFYRLEHAFNFFLEVGAAPPIDMLPALKYLPGPMAPWKAKAASLRAEMKHFYGNVLFQDLKARIARGEATDCWMAKLLESNADNVSDECLAWNGGVMLEGGSDTTSGALLTFVLAACTHPEAVRKAQEELDNVIGQDRSPVLEDIENLPYCKAFMLEVGRWRPVAPAGVPHLSTKEERYRDYVLPAGTLVVGNIWAILHDPDSFEEPEAFRPERYLQHKYGIKEGLAREDAWRNTFPFGAGRRICLGMHLAENSLSINVPKLLWAFTYAPIGKVSVEDFEPGHLTAPVRFECDIKARSAHIAETIRAEYEAQMPVYEKFNP